MAVKENLFNQKKLTENLAGNSLVSNPLVSNPLVICLSGLDPTGGAGISADIQALQLTLCHPLPLVSCQTNQNGDFFEIISVSDSNQLICQLDAIFAEFSAEKIQVCKIGLIAKQNINSKENRNQNSNHNQLIEVIAQLKKKNNTLQIVFDPIVKPTSAKDQTDDQTLKSILQGKPFNQNDILTPNRAEFFALCNLFDQNLEIKDPINQKLKPDDPIVKKALGIYQKMAIDNILVSSVNKVKNNNKNQLEHWLMQFDASQNKWQFNCFFTDCLIGEYHGSGCTLSACLAGFLAHGQDLKFACENALSLTHLCLKYSNLKGIRQNYPNRLIAFDCFTDLDLPSS